MNHLKKIGAIANGINIDHIPHGNAWEIVRILKLERRVQLGIGLNLTSKKLGIKDLIKIEGMFLSDKQLCDISIFANGATYSEIIDYKVVKKIELHLPEIVENTVICKNHRCISHQYRSLFYFIKDSKNLVCHYCSFICSLSNVSYHQN